MVVSVNAPKAVVEEEPLEDEVLEGDEDGDEVTDGASDEGSEESEEKEEAQNNYSCAKGIYSWYRKSRRKI